MNYLAHLFLAESSSDSLLGNFLGDFIKGSLDNCPYNYNPTIIKGIKTHRQIDVFTDNHRIVRRSKQRLNQRLRRFSGILVDIYYDHFLARHWAKFSDENLEIFIANFYTILLNQTDILPEKLQKKVPDIVAENWLGSYQTTTGIKLTIGRVFRRIQSNPQSLLCQRLTANSNPLELAYEDFVRNYYGIETDFLAFFPELIRYIRNIS
jgi:acyl carrier protein phosphodiesterase